MARHGPKLPPQEIIRRVKVGLKKGGDTHTWEDVCASLASGAFQIFWNDAACIILEVQQFPRKRHCHVFLAAGDLSAVMALQPGLEAYAAEMKCDRITATTRLGWRAVLPKYGWKEDAVLFSLEVPR